MKKFFVAVCLTALVSLNVVAQEVPVVEAPAVDTDVVLVNQDEAAPAEEAAVVNEVAAPVEGTVTAAPVETFVPEAYATPVVQEVIMGSGCGQAAPVYNAAPFYNSAPVATGCSSCGQAAVYNAAPVATGCSSCGQVAAPAYDAGCNTCATADPCCDNGRTRRQVVSRFRGSVRTRTGKIGSRRNQCCN